MRICPVASAYKPQQRVSFKGNSNITANNIDDFIKNMNFSMEKSVSDLLDINKSAYNEKINYLREQRNKNRIEEEGKINLENPLEIKKIFKDEDILNRLLETQNVETPGLVNAVTSYDEYVKADFKKGADYFAQNVENASFKNNIYVPKLNIEEINFNIGDRGAENVKKLYLQFRDNDTVLFNESMDAISNISNNYFTHTAKKLKDINAMYSKSEKWIERIPLGGLLPRIDRVSSQQAAIKFLYQDYKDYCNKFLHNGICPIARDYVEKINKTAKYIDLIIPYLSNSDISFVETASENMQKTAFPYVKKYLKIMDSIITNGSDIAKYYKSINKSGNFASVIKTAASVFLVV